MGVQEWPRTMDEIMADRGYRVPIGPKLNVNQLALNADIRMTDWQDLSEQERMDLEMDLVARRYICEIDEQKWVDISYAREWDYVMYAINTYTMLKINGVLYLPELLLGNDLVYDEYDYQGKAALDEEEEDDGEELGSEDSYSSDEWDGDFDYNRPSDPGYFHA